MLLQLKSLIFGLGEYNKTKLEIRFQLFKNLLEKIEIKNLEDFEIIEDICYKIKEQIRLKSSNLNKVINNPAKSLKKQEVLDILLKLDLIKQNFLNSALNLIDYKSTNLKKNYEKKDQTFKENNIQQKNFIENEKKLLTEDIYNNSNLSQILIIENDDYKVTLENGKVAYIMIYFKKILDYTIIKNFLIIFFEVYLPHGTNVIVENNRVLIVPRMINDKLFILPKIENVNLYEIFSKLYSNIDIEKKIYEKKEEETLNSSQDSNYLNISEIKQNQKFTSINKDIGLDSLLSKETKNQNKVKNFKKSKDKIEFIKDEPIKIEKKDFELKDIGIQLIKEKFEDKIDENKEEIIKPEIKVKKEDLTFEQKKEENKEEKRFEEQEQQKENRDYQIYKDDKIVVYLEKNSISLGEIIIESLSYKNISNLSEGDLSYMVLFSKVFSTILFEESKADGTNILYDYNSNKIRIIARFQDDILNLNWKPQKTTEETLVLIKKKLIDFMNNELSNVQDVVKKDVEKVEGEVVSQIENKSDKQHLLEEKAHYILESLKRIP